ncbi:MAG: hypothetical protein OEY79_03075, partial [Anaplasmataceae bacterium]|nr:hypothetical protein [Anaplasmataceae bacterium]
MHILEGFTKEGVANDSYRMEVDIFDEMDRISHSFIDILYDDNLLFIYELFYNNGKNSVKILWSSENISNVAQVGLPGIPGVAPKTKIMIGGIQHILHIKLPNGGFMEAVTVCVPSHFMAMILVKEKDKNGRWVYDIKFTTTTISQYISQQNCTEVAKFFLDECL